MEYSAAASRSRRPRAAGAGGKPGHVLERRNRQELYEIAKKEIPGRSKMGKWDLVEAIRKSR